MLIILTLIPQWSLLWLSCQYRLDWAACIPDDQHPRRDGLQRVAHLSQELEADDRPRWRKLRKGNAEISSLFSSVTESTNWIKTKEVVVGKFLCNLIVLPPLLHGLASRIGKGSLFSLQHFSLECSDLESFKFARLKKVEMNSRP